MSIESALLSALSIVTSALCFFFKLLWKKSEECEKDRRELREEIEGVKESASERKGMLYAFEKCPSDACPFRRPDGSPAFSVSEDNDR